MAVHRDEGVLHHVLGGCLVVHQQDGEPDELAPVGGVQLLDGGVGVDATEAGSRTPAPSLDAVWSWVVTQWDAPAADRLTPTAR